MQRAGFARRLIVCLTVSLGCRRNELVAMDLVITSVMTAFAFVSMIAGIFGMNLRNAMEENHVRSTLQRIVCPPATTSAVCTVAGSLCTVYACADRSRFSQCRGPV